MEPVSRSYAGAVWQVRQKKAGLSAGANPNTSSVIRHGDSFHRTQKLPPHFTGGRGKENAKDGQESTLYKGYILWQGQYLTKEEYRAQKAKNDAIWESLMAGGSASSSTTQPAAEPKSTEDWSNYPADLGSSFHDVGMSTSTTKASLLPSSAHSQKTDDQTYSEYMAEQAGKSPDALWAEWTKSIEQPDEEDWRPAHQSTSLSHSVSVLKPDEKNAPIRTVSPIEEDENEHAGSSTEQVASGYESDTKVGQFQLFGKNFWEKIHKGNRTQPGVYQQVTFDD